jgi:predicted metal-dependent hydrolase
VRRRKGNRLEYLKYREVARVLVGERLSHFNQFYNFKIGRVAIRNQRTRWGSCSKNGNLNFNYRIALLPAQVADYLIVHELCHLGQFNHSPRFWSLVSQTTPNYRTLRLKLRQTPLH